MTPPGPRHGHSRRSFLRLGALVGAGAALGPALSACAGPAGAAGPGTLSLALNRSLVSLDNKLNQFDAAVTVQRAVRQALTRIDGDLGVANVLADRFELTTPTQWTVRLREGVRYSDGSPVAVADVATALELYQQVQGSFLAAFFPEWPVLEQRDERTFTLETERPFPVLDYLMANILITPSAANRAEELQSGVGSGPYVVTASNRGTGDYTLRRNENYWGARAPVDEVRVRFVPDESSRVVSIRSGEVDVIDTISPDSADQLAGLPGVRVESVEGTRTNQLFYNFRKPADHPLSNPLVREALTYAIDQRALVEDVLVGSVRSATGVVSATLRGATGKHAYAHDPRKARQMLDAAGVRDLELTVIWESGEFASDAFVMEAVTQMLGEVGVRTRLREFQPGGEISAWRQGKAGDWDVLGNGYGNPTGLALTSLQGMYGGTAAKEATRDTYQGYVFPHVEQLISAASAEPDGALRDGLLERAQDAIWDTWPCLWAFVPNAVLARRERVGGLALAPNNSYDLSATKLEG
ncbi:MULTISPECIES: ABC transporter substrate-binding protein [Actinosynnema]|uniref:ABC transporter substrate-binding protein n=1 Tax=Actinosynnema TaxID=40566 RepID=UPI0020A4559A|nr:ABC transporter substrate-binding protein [Actinosynnema pretiosum]MCP2092496.1 peptide/nickel transport system substrate-binding protein [Actinosynnema pretiosum]